MSVQPERNEGAPLAFLKFYGSDFLNATASWTMEERGVYLTLLWYAWVNDGLPSDIDRIDRMAPGAKACWSVLESKFPVSQDGMRRNPRQERERVAMRERSDSAAVRGRKGAASRWQANSSSHSSSHGISHSSSHPLAMQQPSETDGYGMAIQISDIRDQTSEIRESESEKTHSLNGFAVEPVSVPAAKQRRAVIRTEVLEELWGLFPRKVGKRKALTLLDKAVREVMDDFEQDDPADAIEWMREKITAMAQATRTLETKFIPHPATWLHQGRYLDPVEAT